MFSAADNDLYLGTDRHAVVTLWFVTAAEPAKVIATPNKADRGFGRKYLAQLNPSWPITPIGQFALNRSAQASKGEFYVAGLPGVAIVQTVIEDAAFLSEIDPKLRNSLPAADVYAFAVNEQTGVGGFAHWSGGVLRRCFSARRARVYEDHGLPEPFEAPYWAGEKAEAQGGIALPFYPIDLVAEAQRAWLGFDPETSPDVNVVAYAIDGRPEPKSLPVPRPPQALMKSLQFPLQSWALVPSVIMTITRSTIPMDLMGMNWCVLLRVLLPRFAASAASWDPHSGQR